jgi:hypothetical protein
VERSNLVKYLTAWLIATMRHHHVVVVVVVLDNKT